MSDSTPSPHNIPGLTTFGNFRAENESWLEECFIEQLEYDQMANDRSMVVFGAVGSGKTALHQYLKRCCLDQSNQPLRLVVEWKPPVAHSGQTGNLVSVQMQEAQVFDSCVGSLLNFLVRYPDRLHIALSQDRDALAWLFQNYSLVDLSTRIEQTIYRSQISKPELLREFLAPPAFELLFPNASPDMVVSEFINVISKLGLQGVWIIAEGNQFDSQDDTKIEEIVGNLRGFLSTLPIFERANFCYKLILPARLEPSLASTTGLSRRRVDPYRLQWEMPALQQLVEHRLRFAIGQDQFSLADLCSAPDLLAWLEKAGGNSPRMWLEQIKPLVTHYLAHESPSAIDQDTWYKLREENPPPLYLDDRLKQIIVGGRQISLAKLPARAYSMLRYLYEKAGNRVVSKTELYYRGYLELDEIPDPQDKQFTEPIVYQHLIDSNLSRIRIAIEPDPANPVLLLTIRGHGVELQTRW